MVRSSRTFSKLGLLAMVVGLGMVGFELSTNFVGRRLAVVAHTVVVTSGVFFSIWGLKEIISHAWPALGQSSVGRHRVYFPTEGWVYVGIMFVVFVGSLVGHSNPLMLVFSLMAGPFIVNGWLTFMLLKRVQASRKLPPRVMAGDAVCVALTLVNQKRWLACWLMTVTDRVASEWESLSPRVVFTRVPPRSERTVHYEIRLEQRGEYELGPLLIATRFPLGLVERGINVSLNDRILVHPRLGRLAPGWREHLRRDSSLAAYQQPRGGMRNDEFHKLREYRRGDDVRAVHWKTSARQGELMVREFQESRTQELLLLIDAWLPVNSTDADRLAVERALSLGATIIADHYRHGHDAPPYLAALGRQFVEWGGSQGDHRLETLLDAFAQLQPSASQTPRRLFEAALPHRIPGRRTLVMTPRVPAVQQELDLWIMEKPAERSRLRGGLEFIEPTADCLVRLADWS